MLLMTEQLWVFSAFLAYFSALDSLGMSQCISRSAPVVHIQTRTEKVHEVRLQLLRTSDFTYKKRLGDIQ